MSQQQTAPKPSLQGVRIKARKGAVKAQAKHEPSGKCFSATRSCSQLNDIYGKFSETNSINTSKQSPRVILTPLHPNLSKPVLLSNISSMQTHCLKSYSSAVFFNREGAMLMMVHHHPHSRSSRQRSPPRWMT